MEDISVTGNTNIAVKNNNDKIKFVNKLSYNLICKKLF